MSSDDSNTTSTTTNVNLRDPSGFLNLDEFGRTKFTGGQQAQDNAPKTAVKIIGTARDDLNGLLGFCTSYNTDRERYMIRMAKVDASNSPNATIMALKPTNLQKATTIERYKAQYQQLLTDPAVRQKVKYYYDTIQNRFIPNGLKLEYVAIGIILLFLILFYLLGFTKTLMLISASLMIGLILQEDIKQKSDIRTVIKNFPSRCKMVLEKQFPFIKRFNINDNIAVGIVGLLLILTIQSIFFTTTTTKSSIIDNNNNHNNNNNISLTRPVNVVPPHSSPQTKPQPTAMYHREQMEKYYHMGFKDSVDGNERGHSLSQELQRLLEEEASKMLVEDEDLEPIVQDIRDIQYSSQAMSSSSSSPNKTFMSKLLSFRTMGSIFYFYRIATSLGIDPSTNIFSFGQLVANVQHSMPPWQKGMMAFSLYNLISNLFF
jgi:hypothetical protein